MPRGSGIKTFLARPNKFGWDVKRKLIWLGTHSYLFRNGFRNYVEDHGGKPEIPIIEDFICQQTTAWSGLGVIDILAATLDISPKQRSTLRSWYERHVAYYRVLSIKRHRMKLLNLINDKPYAVRAQDATKQFKVGKIIFGALTPWDGEWYWSGNQLIYSDLTKETIQQLVQEYGYESIESAFFIRCGHEESHLDYLLRQYKGFYYRRRYPRFALVPPAQSYFQTSSPSSG